MRITLSRWEKGLKVPLKSKVMVKCSRLSHGLSVFLRDISTKIFNVAGKLLVKNAKNSSFLDDILKNWFK